MEKITGIFNVEITPEVVKQNPFYGDLQKVYKSGEELTCEKFNIPSEELPPCGVAWNGNVVLKPNNHTGEERKFGMKIEVSRLLMNYDIAYHADDETCNAQYNFKIYDGEWFCALYVEFKMISENIWRVTDAELRVWFDEEDFDDIDRMAYSAKLPNPSAMLSRNHYNVVKQYNFDLEES